MEALALAVGDNISLEFRYPLLELLYLVLLLLHEGLETSYFNLGFLQKGFRRHFEKSQSVRVLVCLVLVLRLHRERMFLNKTCHMFLG